MKKILLYTLALLLGAIVWTGCEKYGNYAGGTISPYLPLYDLRGIYKGSDVTLNEENMFGSTKITGVVVSDYTEGNMPPGGYLVIQEKRRLGQLRGITIPIGDAARGYVSGDSVIIDVVGGVLKRADGILQVTNVPASAVTKVSSGNPIPPNRVPSSFILANPNRYESTLVAIVKGGFDPIPTPADKISGERIVNDGFENIKMITDASADFADEQLPVSANFFGIVFNVLDAENNLIPHIRMRMASDVRILSSEVTITPIVISGFISDVKGGDGNYEYMQFLATEDIDFKKTPYSVVVTNNAGSTSPIGFPSLGWATGSLATKTTDPDEPINSRTYKFDLTSGFAAKGTFFYVGGSTKMINGSKSTSMSSSNWIKAKNYSAPYSKTSPKGGDGDGFGNYTSGLFPNSGNASGFAVFKGTTVTKDSKPIDVIFIGSGGSLFSQSAAEGYRITNTDWYDEIDPLSDPLVAQPFYRQGSNTLNLGYNAADKGFFYKLGGIYNPRLGRWVKARSQYNHLLAKDSPLSEIEDKTLIEVRNALTDELIRVDTAFVTSLKE